MTEIDEDDWMVVDIRWEQLTKDGIRAILKKHLTPPTDEVGETHIIYRKDIEVTFENLLAWVQVIPPPWKWKCIVVISSDKEKIVYRIVESEIYATKEDIIKDLP